MHLDQLDLDLLNLLLEEPQDAPRGTDAAVTQGFWVRTLCVIAGAGTRAAERVGEQCDG